VVVAVVAAVAAVAAVVMVMETAEDSATPHRIRTATMPTMVATAQAAVARLEGAVEVEVTKFLAIVRIRLRPLLRLLTLVQFSIIPRLYAYFFWFRMYFAIRSAI
jgi:hypothetical protein